MVIKLNQQADHGFDEPLGLLSDCHRRIERFLGVMLLVAREDAGRPLPPDHRRALVQAVEYFRTAAPRHTADEEASLFPRLQAASHPEAARACALMARLDADHRAGERRHARAEDLALRWVDEGTLPDDDVAELTRTLEALEGMYRSHIAAEDHELFPAAARILGRDDLEQVGREMADRRGVRFQPHGLGARG